MPGTKMAAPPAKRARHNELNGEFEEEEDPAVSLFREYLRIPTVSRGDDYQKHYGEIRSTLRTVALRFTPSWW